jgi:hypothetical protein
MIKMKISMINRYITMIKYATINDILWIINDIHAYINDIHADIYDNNAYINDIYADINDKQRRYQ